MLSLNKPKTVNTVHELLNKNRTKSIGKINTKNALPNVKKRERTMVEELKTNFVPYSLKSYKEKFGSKYVQLGGLGMLLLINLF